MSHYRRNVRMPRYGRNVPKGYFHEDEVDNAYEEWNDGAYEADSENAHETESINNERLIAVVEPTGAGKSTLIKNIVNNESIDIGHDLSSETAEVEEYSFQHNGVNFILVDTPGFEDSHRSNQEVTEQILQWLEDSYRSGRYIDGIIYVHSIMNPRMQGRAYQNLRMFKRLCGKDAMKNVVLATSFWDLVDPDMGRRREQELKLSNQFWGEMARNGSEVFRLGTRAQNLGMLERIANYKPIILLAQDEMVNKGKTASQTSASQITAADLEGEKKKHDIAKVQFRRKLEKEAREKEEAHQREKERLQREVEEHAKRMEEERERQEEEHRRRLEKDEKQRRWDREETEYWPSEHPLYAVCTVCGRPEFETAGLGGSFTSHVQCSAREKKLRQYATKGTDMPLCTQWARCRICGNRNFAKPNGCTWANHARCDRIPDEIKAEFHSLGRF